MMSNHGNLIGATRALCADTRQLCARQWLSVAEMHSTVRNCRRLVVEAQALLGSLDQAEPPPPPQHAPPGRKRSKLVYKHRWLVSANVVAALRRAGVDCNIIVPAESDLLAAALPPSRLSLN